jgi:Ca2+-transporting ATPase
VTAPPPSLERDIAQTLDNAPPWHALSPDAAAAELGVDAHFGLSGVDADARLEQHGQNSLAEPERRPAWLLFVDQFRNVLVGVLAGAAVLAGLVGDFKDTIIIAVVLVANAALGFVQEHRAERSLAALRSMLVPTATVRRDGAVQEIAAETLVPGDIVVLETGDRVPADGRLVVAASLEIAESALTGESTPVIKTADAQPVDLPLAERASMAYMNTVVTRGRAELLVTGTGMATEIGTLAGLLDAAVPEPTPLQRQLATLGRRIAFVGAAAVAVFFVVNVASGASLSETALASVALAVAAIPEGLPAVVTVTLAVGVHQMAKRGAIVKRLASVETLGATTVICSDKTGTLTLNEMTARAVIKDGVRYDVTGSGYQTDGGIVDAQGRERIDDVRRLLELAVACNNSRVLDGVAVGDPTEAALITLGAKGGVHADEVAAALPRVAELQFDAARKYMATFHRGNRSGETVVAVKGGADVLLAHCSFVATANGPVPLDAHSRADLDTQISALASEGLRVLALAERLVTDDGCADRDESALLTYVDDLQLVGLVGLLDPPRPEAATAIAACRRAGIDVKMITGDHAATATAIAQQLGLSGATLTGADLDRMGDVELAEVVESTAVFARVTPEHKVRLVRALRAKGHVTAMTGDGVNDAPALKSADIGIAMGVTGTEVSKEAAAMVLTDDNFATIVRAVEAGRGIYDNIVKFVRFQMSTNIGAIASLIGAPLFGLPVPFTAVQVLWVNLIMDGPPALALGVDPPRRDAMERPPRPRGAAILTHRRLVRLLGTGIVMAAGTLGVLAFGIASGTEEHALALAFTTFVLFQVFNALCVRSETESVFSRSTLRNGKLWAALATVVALQVAAVHVDVVQGIFGTADFTGWDWLLVSVVASTVLWLEEARKLIVRHRS